ncbi:type II toxin-antitoxin system VapC family toxin [Phyllobacterium sophorae]|uniref:VapC toxin family PIN domain ribonuclease n=1 Tax=Phyllobacterium sophorae TaxID=1520277 RepID=A0A2P7BDM3_9HYPH|nr:PIN domain nuclease [Phyllobacterium sophorae]PSH64563.1 VapC toxin family PIN domain ribonuclease [Phyllobacterium sophorae]
MIVVDSSVLIAHQRNIPIQSVQKLRSLKDLNSVIVGDLVMLEILQGARSEAEAKATEQRLRKFEIRNMLSTHIAVSAARNYRYLRLQGITIRKSIDMIIGTFCIEGGHQLLHHDRDFGPMVEHLGLQVL